jgi:hypothetical protein
METIKLNNVHIIKDSIFKEFKNKRVSIQYYWKNNDRLIGWNDSNTLKSSYSEVDVLIKCLTFENTRFRDVLENIKHRYRVDIKEHTSVSMDKRLSMTIVNEQLEAVMEVISTLLPISYEIHGNSLIIKDND